MNGFPGFLAREVELVSRLEIHPEISRHAEITSEPQSRVRSDAPPARQKLIKAVGRYLDNIGEFLGGEVGFFQLVSQYFAGMDRCAGHDFSSASLAIVYNLDIPRSPPCF